MSKSPLWHDDILVCYPALLDRLKSISPIKKVQEIKELSEIDNQAVAPLDGVVYVIFDGLTPTDPNNDGREQVVELGFTIILAKQQYNPRPRMDGVGASLTAICKALQGYEPEQDGRALTLSPFVQKQALAVRYFKNYALFPLRFTTTVAVMADS
ncbi:MAG: hypothetical protein Q3971_06855 [Moraxella sp.]|nr:hypothetical protein [Moraxella sp.]